MADRIDFPAFDTQTVPCPKDSTGTPSFFARGHFDTDDKLDPSNFAVTYKDSHGHTQTIAPQLIIHQPYDWVAKFADAALITANGTFTLKVCNKATPAHCLSRTFTVPGVAVAPPAGPTLKIFDIDIAAPELDPSGLAYTVRSTFASSGTSTSQHALNGSLIDGSGNIFPGNTLYDQDQQWLVQFTNIRPGTYTLTLVAEPFCASRAPIVVVPDPAGAGATPPPPRR